MGISRRVVDGESVRDTLSAGAVGQYAQRRVSDCRQMMLTGTLASFSVVPLVKRTLVGTRRCTYASWGGIGRLGTARAPEPKSPTGLMPRESEKAL